MDCWALVRESGGQPLWEIRQHFCDDYPLLKTFVTGSFRRHYRMASSNRKSAGKWWHGHATGVTVVPQPPPGSAQGTSAWMSPHVPRPGKPHGDAKEGSTEVKVKTAKAARHQVLRLRLKVIFPDNEVAMFSRQDFERVLEDERTNFGQSFMDETLQQRQGLLRQRGWRFEGEGYTGDLPSFNLREAAERTNLEWEFIVGQRAVENGDGAQPGVATTATTATTTATATGSALLLSLPPVPPPPAPGAITSPATTVGGRGRGRGRGAVEASVATLPPLPPLSTLPTLPTLPPSQPHAGSKRTRRDAEEDRAPLAVGTGRATTATVTATVTVTATANTNTTSLPAPLPFPTLDDKGVSLLREGIRKAFHDLFRREGVVVKFFVTCRLPHLESEQQLQGVRWMRERVVDGMWPLVRGTEGLALEGGEWIPTGDDDEYHQYHSRLGPSGSGPSMAWQLAPPGTSTVRCASIKECVDSLLRWFASKNWLDDVTDTELRFIVMMAVKAHCEGPRTAGAGGGFWASGHERNRDLAQVLAETIRQCRARAEMDYVRAKAESEGRPVTSATASASISPDMDVEEAARWPQRLPIQRLLVRFDRVVEAARRAASITRRKRRYEESVEAVAGGGGGGGGRDYGGRVMHDNDHDDMVDDDDEDDHDHGHDHSHDNTNPRDRRGGRESVGGRGRSTTHFGDRDHDAGEAAKAAPTESKGWTVGGSRGNRKTEGGDGEVQQAMARAGPGGYPVMGLRYHVVSPGRWRYDDRSGPPPVEPTDRATFAARVGYGRRLLASGRAYLLRQEEGSRLQAAGGGRNAVRGQVAAGTDDRGGNPPLRLAGETRPRTWSELPLPVWATVATYLNVRDLASCASTCTALRRVAAVMGHQGGCPGVVLSDAWRDLETCKEVARRRVTELKEALDYAQAQLDGHTTETATPGGTLDQNGTNQDMETEVKVEVEVEEEEVEDDDVVVHTRRDNHVDIAAVWILHQAGVRPTSSTTNLDQDVDIQRFWDAHPSYRTQEWITRCERACRYRDLWAGLVTAVARVAQARERWTAALHRRGGGGGTHGHDHDLPSSAPDVIPSLSSWSSGGGRMGRAVEVLTRRLDMADVAAAAQSVLATQVARNHLSQWEAAWRVGYLEPREGNE